MIRPIHVGPFAVFALLWPLVAQGAPAQGAHATRPATRATTRPDPHLWTKRNVDLIRAAATAKADPLESGSIGSVVMFSLGFNPLLMRDPYAAETLKLLEDALAKRDTDPSTRAAIASAAKFLRLTEEQRILRQLARAMQDDPDNGHSFDKPVVRAGNEGNLTADLSFAPAGEPYDAIVTRTIDQMDAAARSAGKWEGLALAYFDLAHRALDRNEREKARPYIDRMIAILREHPGFQNPARGNTDAVDPSRLATLLRTAGRHEDLSALIRGFDGQLKIDATLGLAVAVLDEGKFDDARRIVESQVRPLAPATADRLSAALDGKVTPAPATTATAAGAGRRAPTKVDPSELRMLGVLTSVAHALARRGDVETAARQLVILEAARFSHRAEKDLPSYQWARLAHLAHHGGHAAAAKKAFEWALDALSKASVRRPAETNERIRFVREALDVGDVDLARSLLSTTSAPGAGARHQLATTYRQRGDAARADALIKEAIQMASQDRGEGNVMADIAVDLHAAGQVERAEKLLIDAIDHIEGVDFGFSGTAAIVSAACRMNRLDLLDRCYETYDDSGNKMLLCIAATRAGVFGVSEREED